MKNTISVAIEQKHIDETVAALRAYGQKGCEGLVLWLGEVGVKSVVKRVLVPPQNSIKNESGVGYFVNEKTLLELNRYLRENSLKLIAQIHSHPASAYHSDPDDRYAIVTKEGGLSLVVPDFAFGPANISNWAVYRLKGQSWKKMFWWKVKRFFEVC